MEERFDTRKSDQNQDMLVRANNLIASLAVDIGFANKTFGF